MTGSSHEQRRLKVLVGLAAGLVVFYLVRSLIVADPSVLEGPSLEILGRWTTDVPRYQDRAFVIGRDVFHLEVGDDSILSYRLAEVRLYEGADFDRYELTYHTREGEAVQEFRLFPDGELRLRNPPDVVWTRQVTR